MRHLSAVTVEASFSNSPPPAVNEVAGVSAVQVAELFLAARTTPRRATANALAGLGVGVMAMYALTPLLTAPVGAGQIPGRRVAVPSTPDLVLRWVISCLR